MDAGSMSFLLLLTIIICLIIFFRAIIADNFFDSFLPLIVVIFLALCFVAVPLNGEPAKNINNGDYQVAYVYEGVPSTVTLGLEVQKSSTESGLRVYIFPKDAFSGEIKKEAKQLKVFEVAGFRKLVLQ